MKYRIILLKILSAALVLFSTIGALAGDENARKTFNRLMESAHPTPTTVYVKDCNFPYAKPERFSIFNNVNTIEDEQDPQPIQNESSIAVNPKNPLNLIASAVDYREKSSTWVYVSHDGGKTWENLNLGKPFENWRSTNDPSVAFDADGVGYLVYGGFGAMDDSSHGSNFGENGVFIARSFNEGVDWQAHIPVILHKGEMTMDSLFEDKYYIEVDESPESDYFGRLYIPWKRVTPRDSATQIVISHSTDKGLTWSEPLPVSPRLAGTSEDTTYGQSFPLAATGPDGEVYLVWNNGIERGVGYAKSTDGGESFSEPDIIQYYNIFGKTTDLRVGGDEAVWRHALKGHVRAEAYPVVVCDNTDGERRGWVYLCWTADEEPNIYFSRSETKGASWSEPVIVHSETDNDQFWQWMSVDPTSGDIAIMYLDSRADPDNIMVECYASYSSDGGDTWIDRRVSDVASDIRRNPFSGHFAGDYSGCAFYDGIIYPSWVDMRNAAGNIDNDVYTAIVDTRALRPPEDFVANVLPGEPFKLNLTWTPPQTRAFGQPVSPNEYEYELRRDGEFLAILDGESSEYLDESLEAYKEYEYKIKTFAGSDSSVWRNSAAVSGGARELAPAELSYLGTLDEKISIKIDLPESRADGATPITEDFSVKIFRDSVLVDSIDFSPSAAGNVYEYIDEKTAELPDGFYKYYSIVESQPDPGTGQETRFSEPSAEIVAFAGEALLSQEYRENFDGATLFKYSSYGDWAKTGEFFRSAPFSLTESPEAKYDKRQNAPVYMFKLSGESRLSFYCACFVDDKDGAFLEISKDNMASWDTLAIYNEDMFPPWSDGEQNADDWKFESFDLSGDVFVRFRFESDAIINREGWFIDDIAINDFSSVKGQTQAPRVKVYPNPANRYLNVALGGDDYIINAKLISTLGEQIPLPREWLVDGAAEAVFDVSNLAPGGYFLILETGSGVMRELVRVYR